MQIPNSQETTTVPSEQTLTTSTETSTTESQESVVDNYANIDEVIRTYSRRVQKLIRRQTRQLAKEVVRIQRRNERQRLRQIREIMSYKSVLGGAALQGLIDKYTNKEQNVINMRSLMAELQLIIARARQERIDQGKRKKTTGRSSDRKVHKSLIEFANKTESANASTT